MVMVGRRARTGEPEGRSFRCGQLANRRSFEVSPQVQWMDDGPASILRWAVRMASFAVIAILPSTLADAQVRTLAEPLEKGDIETEVFFINETDEAVSFRPPSRTSTTRTGEVELVVLHARDGSPITIPARGFVKLLYGEVPKQGVVGAAAVDRPLDELASTNLMRRVEASFRRACSATSRSTTPCM